MNMDIDDINRRAAEVRRSGKLDDRHKELLRLLDEALAMWRRSEEKHANYVREDMRQHDEEYGK